MLHGIGPLTTKEISKGIEINPNTCSQILRRMQDYGLLRSRKGITTTYVVEDLSSKTVRKTLTHHGDGFPSGVSEDIIIEKKRKRVVHWSFTDQGRRYAKYIWFNPAKYKIRPFLDPLIMDLVKGDMDNDYVSLLDEEIHYNENMKTLQQQEMESPPPPPPEVKPIYQPFNIEKYAKVFAADHFREQGYEVVVYDYPIYDYDIDIIKDYQHSKVIVIGLRYDEYDKSIMKSDLKRIFEGDDEYKICIVKMTEEDNPVISVISFH
jgi:hypothetical protein